MKLKHIKLRNADEGDAPFDGVVLTSCKSSKVGMTMDIDVVINNLSEDEGIVFEGDWHIRPIEFVEILRKINDNNLRVMIYTELSLDEFKLRIGLGSFNHVNGTNIVRKNVLDADIPMLVFMGSVLMDYYLQHTEYYVFSKEKEGHKLNTIKLPKEELENE